jgi:hypothetical protein
MSPTPTMDRIIGWKKVYSKEDRKWGKRESISLTDTPGNERAFQLPNGGLFVFTNKALSKHRCQELSTELETNSGWRQYCYRKHYKEPRIHHILSSKATALEGVQPGYNYRGVDMKSSPQTSKRDTMSSLACTGTLVCTL